MKRFIALLGMAANADGGAMPGRRGGTGGAGIPSTGN